MLERRVEEPTGTLKRSLPRSSKVRMRRRTSMVRGRCVDASAVRKKYAEVKRGQKDETNEMAKLHKAGEPE